MGNSLDYFWETEKNFVEFLKKTFGADAYKRKFSLTGDGIFNLLLINGDIYEIRYKEAKKHFANQVQDKTNRNEFNGGRLKGDVKQDIMYKIANGLKLESNQIYTDTAKLSFPVHNWIAKVEIVKKNAMPT